MNLQMIVSWLQARLDTDERGAALVEYGLLVALIAVVCIVTVGLLGTAINAKFDFINTHL
jgi:pilus assembly protein Flp/PilA